MVKARTVSQVAVDFVQSFALSSFETHLNHLRDHCFVGIAEFVAVGNGQKVIDRRPTVLEKQVDFSQRFGQAVPVGGLFSFGQQRVEVGGQLLDRGCDVGWSDFVVGRDARLIQQRVVAGGHIAYFD